MSDTCRECYFCCEKCEHNCPHGYQQGFRALAYSMVSRDVPRVHGAARKGRRMNGQPNDRIWKLAVRLHENDTYEPDYSCVIANALRAERDRARSEGFRAGFEAAREAAAKVAYERWQHQTSALIRALPVPKPGEGGE
jgi:hypothetical protein